MDKMTERLERLDSYFERAKAVLDKAIKEGREIEFETSTGSNGLELLIFRALPPGEIQDVSSLGYG